MKPSSWLHAWRAGTGCGTALARLALFLATLLAAFLFTGSHTLQPLEDRFQDTVTANAPQRPAPVGVVVVDIAETSLATLGPWPWSRATLAQLAESLRAKGARLQVWDVMLPEAAAGDEQLNAALSKRDVVLGQVLVVDPAVQGAPHEGRLLASASGFGGLCSRTAGVSGFLGVSPGLQPGFAGHVGATPDTDGRLRRVPAVICHEGRAYPQLTLAAAEAATPQGAWKLEEGFWPWEASRTLVRGSWRFPLDADGWLRVPYARSHAAWPAVTVEQVLDPARRLPELEGSIVLLGSTALGLADIVNTPFYPVAPGVSVHAEVAGAAAPVFEPSGQSVAAQRWVVVPRGAALWSTLLVALLGACFALNAAPQAPTRQAMLWSAVVLVLPAFVAPVGREWGLMLPVAAPTTALAFLVVGTWLFNAAWLRHQSLSLARHLQGFMPAPLARQIAAVNPTSDSLGHAEQGVVMAIHLDGLPRWQDSVDPVQALGVIHALHATAQAAVAATGGRLEQAQGATLMAAWPTPAPHEGALTHAVEQALAAARRCQEALVPLLQRNESESHPLSISLAVEAGPYLLGVVGHSDSRRTVLLGPAVAAVQGMLELSEELASPVLVGPLAARAARHAPVQRLGSFVLPDQGMAKELFRLNTLSTITAQHPA